MSIQELCRVFELPDGASPILDQVTTDLPFLRAAPVSVLLHFGRQVLATPTTITNLHNPCTRHNTEPPDLVNTLFALDTRQKETAAHSDDAKVPIHLWDEKLWALVYHDPIKLSDFKRKYDTKSFRRKYCCEAVCPLQVLRHWTHSQWIRNAYKDLVQYARHRYGPAWTHQQQGTVFLDMAIDAIYRVVRSSFWEWTDGSTLMFLRWPTEHVASALNGYPSWILGDLPRYCVPQRKETSVDTANKVTAKLQTVRGSVMFTKAKWTVSLGIFWCQRENQIYNLCTMLLNRA